MPFKATKSASYEQDLDSCIPNAERDANFIWGSNPKDPNKWNEAFNRAMETYMAMRYGYRTLTALDIAKS